jgi:hypothetical protein
VVVMVKVQFMLASVACVVERLTLPALVPTDPTRATHQQQLCLTSPNMHV